nr:hypothetical protein [Methanothrix sp.]
MLELTRPAYRGYEVSDISKLDWNEVVIEAKFDGMRIQIEHDGREVEFYSDEGKRKHDRLPYQAEEAMRLGHEPFVLDSECIVVKDGKARHRTEANALLNGKFDPSEAAKHAYLMVFDVLKFEGDDVRSHPYHERIELLGQFRDTEHLKFMRPTRDLDAESYSYIVRIDDPRLQEIVNRVSHI